MSLNFISYSVACRKTGPCTAELCWQAAGDSHAAGASSHPKTTTESKRWADSVPCTGTAEYMHTYPGSVRRGDHSKGNSGSKGLWKAPETWSSEHSLTHLKMQSEHFKCMWLVPQFSPKRKILNKSNPELARLGPKSKMEHRWWIAKFFAITIHPLYI